MGEAEDEVLRPSPTSPASGSTSSPSASTCAPTTNHLPVARWVRPEEFTALKQAGEALGLGHVEASPLTRSSYHAKQAAGAVGLASPALR